MSSTCPVCGAPATDHGGISQCTADVTHIDVYDLSAVNGPVTLRCKPRSPGPRPRPDSLTEGERAAVGWARKHHARCGDLARSLADAMRRQFPWIGDDDLTRIALYFGGEMDRGHWQDRPDLDVTGWASVLKAAAVELANLELTEGTR